MPRFQKDNGVYYAPPEICRLVKVIKGNSIIKVLYDPQLEYAQGETKNYVKDDFIVSVDDQRYDTLTLYTDLDKASVLSGMK